MVSKKTEREIVRAVERSRWALPLTFALMASVFLPSGLASAEAAEEEAAAAEDSPPMMVVAAVVDTDEEIVVEEKSIDDEEMAVDAEVNEDSLKYLLLVDSFETAERIPTRRLATPADVTVITADEISANHYQSIPEALSHITGLISGNGLFGDNAFPGAIVNGSDRVLMLVNGRRTFMYPPMKAIERIEIVKGGGSALYGSDAVGGVINVITKRGDHNETTLDVNLGSGTIMSLLLRGTMASSVGSSMALSARVVRSAPEGTWRVNITRRAAIMITVAFSSNWIIASTIGTP